MIPEILDQIIDEIIKNDRRGRTQPVATAGRHPLAPLQSAWNAWVPEIARQSPGEALSSLGSGWGGLAQAAAEERLRAWGPNHLPRGGRGPSGLLGWLGRPARAGSPRAFVIRTRSRADLRPRPLWVASEQLAPGDLLLLSAGDTVPADVRLLRVRDFRVDERALTGNGKPVAKAAQWDQAPMGPLGINDLAYGGTRVLTGTATGVVVATGDCMLLALLGRG